MTGAGGSLIVQGLLETLARGGMDPRPVALGAESGPALSERLESLAPDLVWVVEAQAWPFFAPLKELYPHVLYLGDPEWEVEKLRRRVRARRQGLLRQLLEGVRSRHRVVALRRQSSGILRACAERGAVAAWSLADMHSLEAVGGAGVQYCPPTFPDWGRLPASAQEVTPRALLLGNFSTTATRHGLRYFFDRVWPAWASSPERARAQVRVVGAGRLPEGFVRVPQDSGLVWVGHAPSLEEEWARAAALLVPVPTRTGIRTRVAEAWCRGVPVIAHPAAEASLPMMRPGVNYLCAEAPEEWLAAFRRLETEPDLAPALAKSGRAAFDRELSAAAGAGRFSRISELAVRRWSSSRAAEAAGV